MTQELVGTGLVAGTWTIDPAHSTSASPSGT